MRRIYSGKDFQTLKSEIKSKLERQFEDVSFDYENDLTNVLLDSISYAAENISWFLDFQANEIFIGLAKLQDSLAELAAFSGYNPQGAVPASGTVSIRPDQEYDKNVLITEGTRFSATNGLTYLSTESVLWSPNSTDYKEVDLSQGERFTTRFRSDAERKQRFELTAVPDEQFLSYKSTTVTVDGEEWEEVDRFRDDHTSVYRVAYTADPPYIEFGDNAAGEIPKENAEIFVEYQTNNGLEGNLSDPGGISSVADTITTSSGESVGFEFDDSTGVMSGGDDAENLREVRSSIPLKGMADGAVVTEKDIRSVLNTFRDPNFGSVASATAYVARSIEHDPDSLLRINSVLGSIFDAEDTINKIQSNLSDSQSDLSSLSTFISNKISDIQDISTSDIEGTIGDIEALIVSAKNNITDTKSNQKEIRELVDQILADYDSGTNSFSNPGEVRSDAATIGELADESNNLSSQVKSNLSDILNSSQNIYNANPNSSDTGFIVNIEDIASNLDSTSTSDINDIESKIQSEIDRSKNDLEDPWLEGEQKIKNLKDHLDTVFTDVCGPNLISVPILSYDSDGFYTKPSIGLRRSFEQYLEDKREPSMIFNVVDGSKFLVKPKIEFSFKPKRTFSPNKIRSAIETNVQNLIKGSEFGENLYLDDIHANVRQIEGIEFLNVEITGFNISIGKENSDTEKDNDGNLIVADKEVLTRGILTFFRVFEDGSKEPI